jgi:hypothetical protein
MKNGNEKWRRKMKTEIKNGTVFDGIIKIEFFYRWRPIQITTIVDEVLLIDVKDFSASLN